MLDRNGYQTFVLAELGSNHDRSMSQALRLLDAAKAANASAVKLQDFGADQLASARYPALRSALERVELPDGWLAELVSAAKDRNIPLVTTPFDEEAVGRAADLGLPMIKVASGDVTNHRLLRAIAAVDVPVVVSTGAATISEVEAAVGVLAAGGAPETWLLHCVSQYPTEVGAFTLNGLRALQSSFPDLGHGISDHSPGSVIPVAAVALGARFLEKHLTLDRGLSGPDHSFSLEPDEFAALVRDVRAVEAALAGPSGKQPLPGELPERFWARRGLYARRSLPAGTVLQPADLVALRPCAGIGAEYEQAISGRSLTRTLEEGESLEWTHL